MFKVIKKAVIIAFLLSNVLTLYPINLVQQVKSLIRQHPYKGGAALLSAGAVVGYCLAKRAGRLPAAGVKAAAYQLIGWGTIKVAWFALKNKISSLWQKSAE